MAAEPGLKTGTISFPGTATKRSRAIVQTSAASENYLGAFSKSNAQIGPQANPIRLPGLVTQVSVFSKTPLSPF